MKNSLVVNLAKFKYLMSGKKKLERCNAPFGLAGIPLSGTNMTQQLVGGTRFSIIPVAGRSYMLWKIRRIVMLFISKQLM